MKSIFNSTSNREHHCYNDRSENPCFFLYLSHSFYFCNIEYRYRIPPELMTTTLEGKKEKKAPKFLTGKKSHAFCLAWIVTVQTNKQCRLSCLFSTQFSSVKRRVLVSHSVVQQAVRGMQDLCNSPKAKIFENHLSPIHHNKFFFSPFCGNNDNPCYKDTL